MHTFTRVALAVALLTLARPSRADPVRTLDLRPLFNASLADIGARRAAYDTLVAAACVQGIANRAAPNLYLFYVQDNGLDTDQLWFTRLQDPVYGGGVVSGRTVETLATIDLAVDAYASLIAGLVVWDENVPATVNAAFTAAGADNLVAVRWDASPTSLYARLRAKGLQVSVWLVNQDGTSLFLNGQGNANVPGTTRQTSQDAKADTYVWSLEKYLKANKLDPTELGYMLDASWVKSPNDYNGNAQPTSQLQVTNRDWLVARRGLPFDVSPWTDVAPTDDPTQPVGTDPGILREILTNARAQAGTAPIMIRGFFGWQFKYTTLEGLPAGHEPVMGEWTSVKLVSPFAAGLDADAPGLATMANASFFSHVPLSETPEPQRRPTPEDLVGGGLLGGLASNGGFEDQLAGWTVHTTNDVVYTDDATTGPRAHGGLSYLECNTSAPGTDTQDNLYRDGPGVPPGGTVTLRAFFRGTGAGKLVIWGLGGTTEQAVTSFTAGAAWSEVRVSLAVLEAGHTTMRGQIYLATPGANLDVDDVAFYQGDAAKGAVEPATYALWFVGDYDAASWIYAFSPTTWDAPGRGVVPLGWDFSGAVATRFPPFFRHALDSRTPRDFFVGADSGPGYGNPSEMDANARIVWSAAGTAAARHLDTSCGWVLNPLDPIDATHLQAVTPYYGDGVLLMSPTGGAAPGTIVDHAPIVALDNMGGDGSVVGSTTWVLGATPAVPSAPTFHAFRTVLSKPADLANVSSAIATQDGARKIRFVDPFSFFELARLSSGGDNMHRASYRSVALPAPIFAGSPVHVALTARNDGWEAWHATGANPYHVGFNVSAAPPLPRTLPALANAYPTRAMLAADVAPGGEAPIAVDLPAIPAPGTYTLQVDMVEEGVSWFETQGDLPMQLTLVVVPPATGDGGTNGEGGTTADGGTMTGGPDGSARDGASGADGGGAPGDSPGGCSCSSAPRGDGSRAASLGGLLFVFGARWRRRHPRRAGGQGARREKSLPTE